MKKPPIQTSWGVALHSNRTSGSGARLGLKCRRQQQSQSLGNSYPGLPSSTSHFNPTINVTVETMAHPLNFSRHSSIQVSLPRTQAPKLEKLYTPLVADISSMAPVVELPLEMIDDVDYVSEGETALWHASSSCSDLETFELLPESGADMNNARRTLSIYTASQWR